MFTNYNSIVKFVLNFAQLLLSTYKVPICTKFYRYYIKNDNHICEIYIISISRIRLIDTESIQV